MAGKLLIRGGQPLRGEVDCSGAKNAGLPVLAASILLKGTVSVANIPQLRDISVMLELLGCMGAEVRMDLAGEAASKLHVLLCTDNLSSVEAPYDLVNAMRASVLVLGPLLARHHRAEVAMPGGCTIGARPIDQHLSALRQMGAEIEIRKGSISAQVDGPLRGADIHMEVPSVTGTENIMMAACLAQGETIIRNAAREPEVVDLAAFLSAAGADIQGAGSDCIRIRGVESLQGCAHSVIPDRIEAATYLTAAAATGGWVRVRGCAPEHMTAVCDKLRQCGAKLTLTNDCITLDMEGKRPRAVDIETSHYPGFPTDVQAPFLALNAVAEGEAEVTETIFENRFRHAQEINRMGARIRVSGNKARSEGSDILTGAEVQASDLRAAASLVVAGLVAQGDTLISGIEFIDRGYERIEEKFRQLGADIRRIQ